MVLITYMWVKRGIPNSKFYFWVTMLESFCIFNYVMFAMVNFLSSDRDGNNTRSKAKDIYELIVLLLFLLIIVTQLLQIAGEIVFYLVQWSKARKLRKIEKEKEK